MRPLRRAIIWGSTARGVNGAEKIDVQHAGETLIPFWFEPILAPWANGGAADQRVDRANPRDHAFDITPRTGVRDDRRGNAAALAQLVR